MARPREFDETAVLDAAVDCFWARGFEATSVRDLADEMGITGASLYNAFGDKLSLYKRSLRHYVAHTVHERMRRLEGMAPVPAITAFFGEVVRRSVDDADRRGCMLVNAGMEMAPNDPELQELVAREFALLEAFFHGRLQAGQADGTVRTDRPAADMAQLLLSVLLGFRVLARGRAWRSVPDGAVRAALASIEPCPGVSRRAAE